MHTDARLGSRLFSPFARAFVCAREIWQRPQCRLCASAKTKEENWFLGKQVHCYHLISAPQLRQYAGWLSLFYFFKFQARNCVTGAQKNLERITKNLTNNFLVGLRASLLDWLGLRPGWMAQMGGGGGRTNEWTNKRTDKRTENLPILQDFVPYRGRCPASPHENQGESRAGQGNR